MSDAYGYSRAPSRSLDEYYEVLVDLYKRGECDGLNGGVPADRLAAELGTTHSAANDNLTQLCTAGRAEVVWGVNPETGRPRQSYRPTDHSEPSHL
jgi:predicted transcriptional regulator